MPEVRLDAVDAAELATRRRPGVLRGEDRRRALRRWDRAARLATERAIAEATTLDLTDLPEDAF